MVASSVHVAGGDEGLADLRDALHHLEDTVGHKAVLLGERHIPLVLLLGVGEAVSDGKALEVDEASVTSRKAGVATNHGAGDGGDVMSSVGLSEDVEVEGLVGGVLLEETVKEVLHVVSHALFVVARGAAIGEACADGLVDPDHRGVVVPRFGVQGEAEVVLDHVRAVLPEEGELGGAAGAAGHPQDDGVGGGIVPGLEHPVEEVLGRANVDVAGVVVNGLKWREGGGSEREGSDGERNGI